ncbi:MULTISPECIES: flagellar hook-length control protein FliK [unclassified Massilia]|uniref:flagellar hook-length control protein FliK n=1 Tax=unclassified Massilia TaxID=2609279 RepID=UPI001783D64D|nr:MULTISPECIES: flagellar hook-length control protein FliK [unclassified Massilia]MBD8528828.1 flagellar hook-length control protein FliK [Massilia sp. CFBP 13647]MBD8673470.1 flagellar hook-length control protein FliK [Massilia sp. CFBP 13721]
MHTNSLPIQFNAPAAPAPNLRTTMPGNSEAVKFGATLTRQIEQRQMEQRQALVRPQAQPAMPQPAMPQQAAAPKPQAAPKPAPNDPKPASREMVKQAAKETEHPASTSKADAAGSADKTAAAGKGEGEETETSPDAKAADAVVDMLALVASFNQVQQAAAPVTPVATQAAAPQADDLLAQSGGKAGVLPEDALAAATDAPQDKAAPGIDPRALDMGKMGESGKLPAERADFASALRDSAVHAASMKEPAPAEALTSLTAQATALQTAQAAGSAPTDRLSARVGTPAWDNQVGQKVIWMVGGEDQSATLELNPPDLGPVQVVLNVSNDLASVTFSSQQLEVRQALENALPRLREMMNESGIALGNATVNAGAEGRQGQDGQGSGRPGGGRGGNGNGGDGSVADVTPRQGSRIIGGAGAVDTFA